MNLLKNVGFENPALCMRCGGACCKHFPGASHPSDWPFDLVTALADALTSKRYAADWREPSGGEKATFYVRPAVARSVYYEPKLVYDGSWGGVCTFWSAAGCELPLRRRPLSCRMMEPRQALYGRGPAHCWAHASHRSIVRAWIPYQQAIHDAARIAKRRLGLLA